jgi:hypothetical protein
MPCLAAEVRFLRFLRFLHYTFLSGHRLAGSIPHTPTRNNNFHSYTAHRHIHIYIFNTGATSKAILGSDVILGPDRWCSTSGTTSFSNAKGMFFW